MGNKSPSTEQACKQRRQRQEIVPIAAVHADGKPLCLGCLIWSVTKILQMSQSPSDLPAKPALRPKGCQKIKGHSAHQARGVELSEWLLSWQQSRVLGIF